MRSCEDCQAQILEYLYDLLETSERQQLQAHLDACPACQEALRQGQAQQGLLAAAVPRLEFPAVRFPAAGRARTTLLPPRHRHSGRNGCPGGAGQRWPRCSSSPWGWACPASGWPATTARLSARPPGATRLWPTPVLCVPTSTSRCRLFPRNAAGRGRRHPLMPSVNGG